MMNVMYLYRQMIAICPLPPCDLLLIGTPLSLRTAM